MEQPTTVAPPLRRMPARFVVTCVASAAFGVLVVVLVLAAAHMGPGARHYSDDFYDAQARAWLSGRWDLPPEVAGIEGLSTPHGLQIYFGVVPSLLRLPLLAATDRFDGELSQLSAIAALLVLVLGTARLTWIVRGRFAPEPATPDPDPGPAPVSGFALLVQGVFVALVAGASSATFLATQSTVFAEATLWAIALTVLAADQLVRFLLAPTRRRAAVAAALAGLALNTRLASGLGAVVPVLGVGAVALVPARSRLARLATALVPDPRRLRPFVPVLALVLGLSFLAFFGTNAARFGHPWKVPFESQVALRNDPVRAENYRNGAGVFSPAYFQTDLLAYFRPDGLRLQPFPLVSFIDQRDVIVGGAAPNTVEPTGPVPLVMPGLFVLAVVGAVLLLRARPARRQRLRALHLPILGAAIPALLILVYTSLAHRYTAEFVPLLVILGAVGAAAASQAVRRPARASVAVGLVVALLWGTWVTVSLSMWVSENNSMRTRSALDAWAGRIADLEARVRPGFVIPQPERPPANPAGWDLLARPDCARVYVATLTGWYAFERAPDSGAFHLLAQPPPDDGRPHALVQTRDGSVQVGLQRSGAATTLVHTDDGGTSWSAARSVRRVGSDADPLPIPLPVERDGTIDLVVDFDWYIATLSASGADADSSMILRTPLTAPPQGVVRTDGYPGRVVDVADPPSRCAQWTSPR